MKEQVVVRTYPTAYNNPTDRLEEYLKKRICCSYV